MNRRKKREEYIKNKTRKLVTYKRIREKRTGSKRDRQKQKKAERNMKKKKQKKNDDQVLTKMKRERGPFMYKKTALFWQSWV